MKIRLAAILAAILVAAAVARAGDYSFKEPIKQTGAFSPTGSLTVENVNGSIDIRTWDKNEILIEGERSAKTEEELKAVDLTIDVSERHATIKVRLPKRSGGWFSGSTIRASVQFTITVPTTAVLDRIVDVNGNVRVNGARGEAQVETVNGQIDATDLGGSAHLKSVNGRVNASFASLAAGQRLSFRTVNGSISVALPRDAGVAVQASVVNGHITCDFPLTLGAVSSGRHLSGTIGDGRAALEAETVNGSIHLAQR